MRLKKTVLGPAGIRVVGLYIPSKTLVAHVMAVLIGVLLIESDVKAGQQSYDAVFGGVKSLPARAGNPVTYHYDPFGVHTMGYESSTDKYMVTRDSRNRRVSTARAGDASFSVFGRGQGPGSAPAVVFRQDGSIEYYIHGAQMVVQKTALTKTNLAYSSDHAGSIRGVEEIEASGTNLVAGFGYSITGQWTEAALSESGPEDWSQVYKLRFQGHTTYPGINQLDYGNRIYSPDQGRFTNVDLAGQSVSPYTGLLNNSVNLVDGDGSIASGTSLRARERGSQGDPGYDRTTRASDRAYQLENPTEDFPRWSQTGTRIHIEYRDVDRTQRLDDLHPFSDIRMVGSSGTYNRYSHIATANGLRRYRDEVVRHADRAVDYRMLTGSSNGRDFFTQDLRVEARILRDFYMHSIAEMFPFPTYRGLAESLAGITMNYTYGNRLEVTVAQRYRWWVGNPGDFLGQLTERSDYSSEQYTISVPRVVNNEFALPVPPQRRRNSISGARELDDRPRMRRNSAPGDIDIEIIRRVEMP